MPRGIKNTTTLKTDMKAKPIKKIFSLLVCVVVIFVLLEVNCSAITISDTVLDDGDYIYGYYNKNVHWSVKRSTEILCVFGEGDFYYTYHIEPYKKYIKKLTVESGITSIQNEALANMPFERIELSDTLKSIGCNAFSNCSSVKKLIIPASVEYIGKGAFEGCDSLEQIYIYSQDIIIDEGAFPDSLDLKCVYFYGENIEIRAGNEKFCELVDSSQDQKILPMIVMVCICVFVVFIFVLSKKVSLKNNEKDRACP